jgi:hypothetical protein
MKKIAIISIVICMPLIAQFEEVTYENAYTFEGTIFETGDNKINFNETWMPLTHPQIKAFPALVICNACDEPASLSDLHAPCRVELTYTEHNKTLLPLKIKILYYYQCDENGFMISTHD